MLTCWVIRRSVSRSVYRSLHASNCDQKTAVRQRPGFTGCEALQCVRPSMITNTRQPFYCNPIVVPECSSYPALWGAKKSSVSKSIVKGCVPPRTQGCNTPVTDTRPLSSMLHAWFTTRIQEPSQFAVFQVFVRFVMCGLSFRCTPCTGRAASPSCLPALPCCERTLLARPPANDRPPAHTQRQTWQQGGQVKRQRTVGRKLCTPNPPRNAKKVTRYIAAIFPKYAFSLHQFTTSSVMNTPNTNGRPFPTS